jgi:hypothetical protein
MSQRRVTRRACVRDRRIVAPGMPRISKLLVVAYILFDSAIALTLILDPRARDDEPVELVAPPD